MQYLPEIIQSYIEYKAKIEGLPVIYVDARNTSSMCPVCGGKLKKAPNGHRMLRCDCGYENDRDVIACLNLLRRNPRCGELPFPPNAFHEVSPKERQRRKTSDTIKCYQMLSEAKTVKSRVCGVL